MDASGSERAGVSEGPYTYTVTEGFFRAAGIPILRGRPLVSGDRRGAEPVAVVSERLADALTPGGNAVGMCVPVGVEQQEGGGCTRIVGIAANVRRRYLMDEQMAYVYRPAAQHPFHQGPAIFTPKFLIRTAPEPSSQIASIRSVLRGIAPDLPYVQVEPLDRAVGADAIRPFRIAARILGVFGALALVLAAVGLYGSLSHLVADRAREVGVRMALGADRTQVVWLVIRRALVPVGIGLLGGLFATEALARLAAAQAHGLSTREPVALMGVLITLFLAAFLATWLPARRAAGLDPMETLRTE
jgi:hypothetical protein